jgi:hypothetical protein
MMLISARFFVVPEKFTKTFPLPVEHFRIEHESDCVSFVGHNSPRQFVRC